MLKVPRCGLRTVITNLAQPLWERGTSLIRGCDNTIPRYTDFLFFTRFRFIVIYMRRCVYYVIYYILYIIYIIIQEYLRSQFHLFPSLRQKLVNLSKYNNPNPLMDLIPYPLHPENHGHDVSRDAPFFYYLFTNKGQKLTSLRDQVQVDPFSTDLVRVSRVLHSHKATLRVATSET